MYKLQNRVDPYEPSLAQSIMRLLYKAQNRVDPYEVPEEAV